MSNIPGDLKFLSSHEWIRVESDGTVTVGISDHAQDLLGDIVFVELPEVGQTLDAESDAAIVESVKAFTDSTIAASLSASSVCPTSGNSTKTISPKRS